MKAAMSSEVRRGECCWETARRQLLADGKREELERVGQNKFEALGYEAAESPALIE